MGLGNARDSFLIPRGERVELKRQCRGCDELVSPAIQVHCPSEAMLIRVEADEAEAGNRAAEAAYDDDSFEMVKYEAELSNQADERAYERRFR